MSGQHGPDALVIVPSPRSALNGLPDALQAMSGTHAWPAHDRVPRSILVVDDSPANLTVLRTVLMRHGHRVDLASNGVEALDQVRSGHYDLVLMDVEMPRLDGVRAAAAIRTLDTPAA